MNIFWTEKNIFGEGGLPVVVEHGFRPSGLGSANCSEHFLDREKYFWRGGLPVVVEDGFHPSGLEVGKL